jgi:hypothetical protein
MKLYNDKVKDVLYATFFLKLEKQFDKHTIIHRENIPGKNDTVRGVHWVE